MALKISQAGLALPLGGNPGQVVTNDGTGNGDWEDALPLFVRPRDHGAKGDLFLGQTASTTASSTTVTLADASLTSADVGKTICINGACNATSGSWTTTISSVTDATHCVVASAPTKTVASLGYAYGTDDTAAINAAITAGMALLTSGFRSPSAQQFTVLFDNVGYMIAGAYTTSRGGLPYYSQIPLPAVSNASTLTGADQALPRYRIEFRGLDQRTKDTAPILVQNGDGPILFCAQTNQTNDISARSNTNGLPSVIGGPATGKASAFIGVAPIVRDLIFLGPHMPEATFCDFRWCAQVAVEDNLMQTNEIYQNAVPAFQTAGGVLLPSLNNNGIVIFNRNQISSLYCGFVPAELMHGTGNTTYQNVIGIGFISDNTETLTNHLAQHFSAWCNYHIAGWNPFPTIGGGPGGGQDAALMIDTLVIEDAPNTPAWMAQWQVTHHVWVKNGTYGPRIKANVHRRLNGIMQSEGLLVAGSTADPVVGANPYGVQISSVAEGRGPITPPSVPSSGTAFGLYYRDAVYVFTGGTVSSVKVGGTTIPYISGTPIYVPSGFDLIVTYSVVPTLSSLTLL